jgi:hypothetical protein
LQSFTEDTASHDTKRNEPGDAALGIMSRGAIVITTDNLREDDAGNENYIS